MEGSLEEQRGDTRVGKIVPQFKVVLAVQCNRCGSVRYANITDVEPEQITASLQAGADAWRDHGEAEHSCDRLAKKPGPPISNLLASAQGQGE